MIRILVTGMGGGVGQGIVKSLKLIDDLDIYIVTADMSELASGLYGGDYSYLVPAASDESYFDKIKLICNDQDIDFYFPGTDVELIKCAKYSKELKESLGVEIIISPVNVIEIADDKYKTITQTFTGHALFYLVVDPNPYVDDLNKSVPLLVRYTPYVHWQVYP